LLTLPVRHNRDDPLAAYFRDAAMPTEQDPTVVARCTEIFLEAATLCCRYASGWRTESDSAQLITPEFNYPTEDGASGLVHLRADLSSGSEGSGLDLAVNEGISTLDWDESATGLFYRVRGHHILPSIVVGPAGVAYFSLAGLRAGGHAELNRFRGVVDDMRAAAFPPPGPAEMEARRRDMESAQARRTSAT
jgi:hypothetical protein